MTEYAGQNVIEQALQNAPEQGELIMIPYSNWPDMLKSKIESGETITILGYGSLMSSVSTLDNSKIAIAKGVRRVSNMVLLGDPQYADSAKYFESGDYLRWPYIDPSKNSLFNIELNEKSHIAGVLNTYDSDNVDDIDKLHADEMGYSLVEIKAVDLDGQLVQNCYMLLVENTEQNKPLFVSPDILPNDHYMLQCLRSALAIDERFPGFLKSFLDNTSLANGTPLSDAKGGYIIPIIANGEFSEEELSRIAQVLYSE